MQVSVIIPVHDVEPWVADCVDSLAQQTLRDFEVVIVDDNSTDASIETFSEAFARSGRSDINVVYTATEGGPLGIARARRQGLQEAHGEYIAFLDADDCFTPRALELMLEAAVKSDAGVVCGGMELFDDGAPEIVTFRHSYPSELTALELLKLQDCGFKGSMCDKFFHRSAFFAVKEWSDGGMQEDCATLVQILLSGQRVATVSHTVYRYRQRRGSTADMKSLTPERLLEQLHTLEANVGIVERAVEESPFAGQLALAMTHYKWAAKMSRAHFIRPMIAEAKRRGTQLDQETARECRCVWHRMFPGLLCAVLFRSNLSIHERLALLRRIIFT